MGQAVFVSRSQPDREAAHGIVAYLEARAIDCWVAPRDVTAAADWAAQIVESIAAARVMVLVFSESANASPQVRREVERAVHRRVTVLPFRVEEVLPWASLEYFLSSQHWLDTFPPPLEPRYARLCACLKSVLAPATLAAAVSAPPARGLREAAPSAAALERLEQELAATSAPWRTIWLTGRRRAPSGSRP